MNLELKLTDKINYNSNIVVVVDQDKLDELDFLSAEEIKYVESRVAQKMKIVVVNKFSYQIVLAITSVKEESDYVAEQLRKLGSNVEKTLESLSAGSCGFICNLGEFATKAVLEGITLSTYSFNKYFKDKTVKAKKLKTLLIAESSCSAECLAEIVSVGESVFFARNMVNEPVSYLTAPVFADLMKENGEKVGLKVTVYEKEWIESQNMNGLLAVNKGSIDPPRFTVLEWKPENAVNKKPLVFVGKGIVFDTGGISLKPSAFMETMKSDMGGAAGIAGAMLAIARNKLDVHVIALIPSTDNRPDGNAYVPGDVIEMRNGVFVEVLNTDAEGRMILADGLSYASELEPDLVIDMATLTGAASMALAEHAVALMGNADDKSFELLQTAGETECERTLKFPFYEEYGELIKSEIADVKNIGGPQAGSITAGKFLEHFTDYPWMHLDISGSAFVKKNFNYRGSGGTGFGVRLLYRFVKNYSDSKK